MLHVLRLPGRLGQHRTHKGVRDHSPGSAHRFALIPWQITAPCFNDGLFVLLAHLLPFVPRGVF